MLTFTAPTGGVGAYNHSTRRVYSQANPDVAIKPWNVTAIPLAPRCQECQWLDVDHLGVIVAPKEGTVQSGSVVDEEQPVGQH